MQLPGFNSIKTQPWRKWCDTAPWWSRAFTKAIKEPAETLAGGHLIYPHISTARGDWVVSTNALHDTMAWIQFDCGVLVNVRVCSLSSLPPLSLFLSPSLAAFICGWIIRLQCLPSQVSVSAVSGWHAAWSFPKVCQLMFSASTETYLRE